MTKRAELAAIANAEAAWDWIVGAQLEFGRGGPNMLAQSMALAKRWELDEAAVRQGWDAAQKILAETQPRVEDEASSLGPEPQPEQPSPAASGAAVAVRPEHSSTPGTLTASQRASRTQA